MATPTWHTRSCSDLATALVFAASAACTGARGALDEPVDGGHEGLDGGHEVPDGGHEGLDGGGACLLSPDCEQPLCWERLELEIGACLTLEGEPCFPKSVPFSLGPPGTPLAAIFGPWGELIVGVAVRASGIDPGDESGRPSLAVRGTDRTDPDVLMYGSIGAAYFQPDRELPDHETAGLYLTVTSQGFTGLVPLDGHGADVAAAVRDGDGREWCGTLSTSLEVRCAGNFECDDGDPATIDTCDGDDAGRGRCEHSPR